MNLKDGTENFEGVKRSPYAMLARHRRRWTGADQNGDDNLTLMEFTDFLHPDECARLGDIFLQEMLEDIDDDNDGKISVGEYIGYSLRLSKKLVPEQIQHAHDTFKNIRDKDSNGYLDINELGDWIIRKDFDHAETEVKHLFRDVDLNADGKLTKDEVMNNYDFFVIAEATNYGKALASDYEF